jgi:hypothetical protein
MAGAVTDIHGRILLLRMSRFLLNTGKRAEYRRRDSVSENVPLAVEHSEKEVNVDLPGAEC